MSPACQTSIFMSLEQSDMVCPMLRARIRRMTLLSDMESVDAVSSKYAMVCI